jgi:micrococcal nuclease
MDAGADHFDATPENPLGEPIVFDDDALRELDPSMLLAASSPCREPVLVRVVAATDGDTIRVEHLDTGVDERVRLIGVNTPEVAHRAGEVDDCYGAEARSFTRMLIGHLVWLTFDQLCVDPYERTLAYVHIDASSEGVWERQLLRRGLGRAFIIGRNRALETLALADQEEARASERGLWAVCE